MKRMRFVVLAFLPYFYISYAGEMIATPETAFWMYEERDAEKPELKIITLKTPYSSRFGKLKPDGSVWNQPISHYISVEGLRLHLVIKKTGASVPFDIVVEDGDGELVEKFTSGSAEVSTGEFWTGLIPGKSGNIKLYTTAGADQLELRIDRYAYIVTATEPQAIVGDPDFQPIGDPTVSKRIQDLAPPIAKLQIMDESFGKGYPCTGFLLTTNLLLTNEHCIRDDDQARDSIALFKYEGNSPKPRQFHIAKLEASDEVLDYALVRIAGNAGSEFGHVNLDLEPITFPLPLVVIQHPRGRAKEVAVKNCFVETVSRDGRYQNGTDFGHVCDTEGGSSGSPIFSFRSEKVVGLHHFGFEDCDKSKPNQQCSQTKAVNQGVHILQIMANLEKEYPEILAELIEAQKFKQAISGEPKL